MHVTCKTLCTPVCGIMFYLYIQTLLQRSRELGNYMRGWAQRKMVGQVRWYDLMDGLDTRNAFDEKDIFYFYVHNFKEIPSVL